jgi:2-methylisocitrate lyase-like PEP mutase family enzyme
LLSRAASLARRDADRVGVATVVHMPTQQQKAERFLALHHGDQPLLLANPWDAGSAKALTTIGYQALATTSSGSAAALGRLDGTVTRDEAIAHARVIVDATDVPISADLENAFADEPDAVAYTIELALGTGLAGGSVEDYDPIRDTIYDADIAGERVQAAAEVAHAGTVRFVLTARAENYLHGRRDLADTIERLQAFQTAGADVLYAPGLTDVDEIRTLVEAVDRPVNVLALPGGPTVGELATVGVKRVSIGGAFAWVALDALAAAAKEFLEAGTYGFARQVGAGRALAQQAFGDGSA